MFLRLGFAADKMEKIRTSLACVTDSTYWSASHKAMTDWAGCSLCRRKRRTAFSLKRKGMRKEGKVAFYFSSYRIEQGYNGFSSRTAKGDILNSARSNNSPSPAESDTALEKSYGNNSVSVPVVLFFGSCPESGFCINMAKKVWYNEGRI